MFEVSLGKARDSNDLGLATPFTGQTVTSVGRTYGTYTLCAGFADTDSLDASVVKTVHFAVLSVDA